MSEPLFVYAIYDNPKDFPGEIVVRRWRVSRGVTAEELVHRSCSLKQARSSIPDGLVCLPRSPSDDPVIVEVWI